MASVLMCLPFGAADKVFQKKTGLRTNFFYLFYFSMSGFGRGSKSNGVAKIVALAPSLRQRRFDVHVKWFEGVEKRTRGIAKAVLLDCFFARVRISVSLFVENMQCFLV